MTEDTVLAVIRSKGVFQINPLAYRNEKTMKILRKMVKAGKLSCQRVSASCKNYTLIDN